VKLGEYNAGIKALHQAAEFYPEHSEIEYRLTGIHFLLSESTKAHFHLQNALSLNFEQHDLLKELFPKAFAKLTVKEKISNYKKSAS
jgi:hypothetical protein